MNPSKRKVAVLKQISKLIPRNLVQKLARKHEVDKQSRAFTSWCHVLSLMYAQLSHAMSLNDICVLSSKVFYLNALWIKSK